MSDQEAVETGESAAREIYIRISPENLNYESEMSLPEVVFWLDVVKAMITKQVLDS